MASAFRKNGRPALALSEDSRRLRRSLAGSSDRGMSLRMHHVTKRFGNSPAVLKDVHLSVREGEFVAVVGRSGCGKSTLLRLIAGLESISGGSLERGGQAVSGTDPAVRVMFQDARLLPWRTVLENVMIGVQGLRRHEAESAALAALESVGLRNRAEEWPAVLSGGQRQRVALARALVGMPRLLLLDEPLGALDALTRIEMQRLIERLWSEQRFTALLVTHDVSEAVALADRVILIEHGRIALDVNIALARPREKNSEFSYFEKLILDRVMEPDEEYAKRLEEKQLAFEI